MWDESGKSYLDSCTGIAVCSLGHCHPRLVEAIREQAGTLMHCSNLYQIPKQAELAEEINTHHVRLPGKLFFSNSGAEANDGLIKSARRFGHKRPQADGSPRCEVITFSQSFHGRSLGAMSATAQAKITGVSIRCCDSMAWCMIAAGASWCQRAVRALCRAAVSAGSYDIVGASRRALQGNGVTVKPGAPKIQKI
ncbi:MAG: aminotransferase class III-fold pyridoxal phosphate-dependent enzyme [Luteolibacter sp.]